jgi:MFS family permease
VVIGAALMPMSEETKLLAHGKELTWWQLMHAGIICLTGFQEGYCAWRVKSCKLLNRSHTTAIVVADLCVINSLLPPIQRSLELCFPCEGDSDTAMAECTCSTKSLVVSVLMVGAAVGGLAGGYLADALGRKRVVMCAAALFIVVAALCSTATAETLYLFMIGRIACGLCVGAGGTAAIAYVAETAPKEHRGFLIQAVEVSLCVGCVFATLVALAAGDSRWRLTMALPGAIATFQLVAGCVMLHESPAWLDSAGRHEEAAAAR